MKTATWNIGDGPNDVKVNDLERIVRANGVTRIGLQEASDRGTMIEDFLDETGWKCYSPPFPGAAAVPILYDPREWKLLRARSVLAVARRFVGPGAGPSTAKDKRINIGVFRHRETRKVRRHLNTHFIASVNRSGLRTEHYRDHARVLARCIGRGRRMRKTEVTMDANAEAGFAGLDPVRATGIRGWTTFATHHNRSIDFVLGADKHTRVATSSDHRAVVGESL